jgi:hypothetical protein
MHNDFWTMQTLEAVWNVILSSTCDCRTRATSALHMPPEVRALL